MNTSIAHTPASASPIASAPEVPPDFDACVQDKMARAATVLSKPVENIFTLSLIFSLSLTPFIVLQSLCPELAVMMMTGLWPFALIPYVLLMSTLGLKMASLFGCGAWYRITGAFRG